MITDNIKLIDGSIIRSIGPTSQASAPSAAVQTIKASTAAKIAPIRITYKIKCKANLLAFFNLTASRYSLLTSKLELLSTTGCSKDYIYNILALKNGKIYKVIDRISLDSLLTLTYNETKEEYMISADLKWWQHNHATRYEKLCYLKYKTIENVKRLFKL